MPVADQKNPALATADTLETEVLLADISTRLENLQKKNTGYYDSLFLANHLKELAKRAAGNYSRSINESTRPQDELAKVWLVSFTKLAKREPVLAARTAFEVAQETGFGCRMGRVARNAAFDNAQNWAAANYPEASKALYEMAEKAPSSIFAGPDKKLFYRAVSAYAGIQDAENEEHLSVETLQNMSKLVERLEIHQQNNRQEQQSLLETAGKILDFTDRLAADHPEDIHKIVHKLVGQLEGQPCAPELQPRLTQAVLDYGLVRNLDEFERTLETVDKLTAGSDSAHQVKTAYLEKVLGNDEALVKEDPVKWAARVTDLVMPYAESHTGLTKKAEKTFVNCLEEIQEENDHRQLAYDLRDYPEVREKVIEKIHERAVEKAQSNNKEQVAASINSFVYVANRTAPHSKEQKDAIEQAFTALERLEDSDTDLAKDKTLYLLGQTQEIGERQASALSGLFKLKPFLSKPEYRDSAARANDFIQTGYDAEQAGPAKYKNLLKATTHEELPAAIDALYQQTMKGEDGLYPITRRAAEHFQQLIEKAETPDQRAEGWKELFFSQKENYALEVLASRHFLAEVDKVATDNHVGEALEILCEFMHEAEREERSFSNLFSDSVSRVRDYIEASAIENTDMVDMFLDEIYGSEFYNKHFKQFKWVVQLDKKLDNLERMENLAGQLDIETEAVYQADFSGGKLARLYNKHAFWDWADRQMEKIPVKAAFAVAASAAAAGASLMTVAASASTEVQAGVVLASLIGGVAAANGAAKLTEYMSEAKNRLASYLTREYQAATGQAPPEPERLSVMDFLSRHSDDEGRPEGTDEPEQQVMPPVLSARAYGV